MVSICERYYRIQQFLLIVLGLWPYNDAAYTYIQRIFFSLLFSFSIFLQIGKIITSASNLETLLQLLSYFVPCLVISSKYATFCLKSKDIKKLIDIINCHWNLIKCKEELKILHQYYYVLKVLTALVTGSMYVGLFLFLTMQIFPKFLDVVMPLNESRPYKLLGLAAFFFDPEKYFALIYVHMIIALSVEVATIVATETMGLVYLLHICGLFKITRFFEFFNSCFEISYFILLVLGVGSLSINMFRLFQAGFKKEIDEMLSIGILVIIHFGYMFNSNLLSQIMTNHSAEVYNKICELPWYSVPVPLQKVLQFMIQRSIKSCKFTLTSVFVGSLEFFASIVSCSLSYFTIFLSVQS